MTLVQQTRILKGSKQGVTCLDGGTVPLLQRKTQHFHQESLLLERILHGVAKSSQGVENKRHFCPMNSSRGPHGCRLLHDVFQIRLSKKQNEKSQSQSQSQSKTPSTLLRRCHVLPPPSYGENMVRVRKEGRREAGWATTSNRSLNRLVSLMKLVNPFRRAALVSALTRLLFPGRENVMVAKHCAQHATRWQHQQNITCQRNVQKKEV